MKEEFMLMSNSDLDKDYFTIIPSLDFFVEEEFLKERDL